MDLWEPDRPSSHKKVATHVLAAMCDLTGFVILVPVSSILSHDLATSFMQDVLLKVGFCRAINVDDGSTFKNVFATMCTSLGIQLAPAAKGNHKAVSVERFFRYLNKAVTIATNDHGNLSKVWLPSAMLAAYGWNSSPIDGTDIVRSIPAVGREFRLPLDISLLPAISPPITDHAQAVSEYAVHMSQSTTFNQEILKLLVEERRAAHAERINESRQPVEYQVGDLVLARVQVQSNAATGTVAKLTYRTRGPFTILHHDHGGSYTCAKAGNPKGPTFKYHGSALSPVPPGLIPFAPIDTPDFAYLNQDHAPSPSPLKHPFGIQQFNEVWFDPVASRPNMPTKFAYTIQPEFFVDLPTNDRFPALIDLAPCPIEVAPILASLTPSALLSAIQSSTDRLFFISYRNDDTLRPCWYLVQVDMECTQADGLSQDYANTGHYYVHFMYKHLSDRKLSDLNARWWPEWHRYTTADDGILNWGDLVPFRPHVTPDPSQYIAWAAIVDLSHQETVLAGPFDFTLRGHDTTRHHVAASQWETLQELCSYRGIVPPTLSIQSVIRSPWSTRKRQCTT